MPKRMTWLLALMLLTGCFGYGQPRSPGASPARPSPVSTALPQGGRGTPVRPPDPGTYTFTVTETGPGAQGQQATQSSQHTDEIHEPSELAPGVFQQRVWHLQDSSRPYHVDSIWRSDATYSLSQHFRQSGLCVFGPPLMGRRFPLKVGVAWSTKSFCANDQPPRRGVTGRSKVVKTEELVIGGEKVSTMVIDHTLTLDGFSGEGSILMEGTEWYSPAHRLEVKQLIRFTSPHAPAAEYIEELKSLHPAPLTSRAPWPATSS